MIANTKALGGMIPPAGLPVALGEGVPLKELVADTLGVVVMDGLLPKDAVGVMLAVALPEGVMDGVPVCVLVGVGGGTGTAARPRSCEPTGMAAMGWAALIQAAVLMR